jgi:Fe2+ transport system protein FeoA
MKKNGVSLTDLREGQTGIVVSVDGSPRMCRGRGRTSRGRREIGRGCAQRLMDLGLTPGAKLTVVKSAPFGGPLEIMVRGSRIALGRGMASRIAVEVT